MNTVQSFARECVVLAAKECAECWRQPEPDAERVGTEADCLPDFKGS